MKMKLFVLLVLLAGLLAGCNLPGGDAPLPTLTPAPLITVISQPSATLAPAPTETLAPTQPPAPSATPTPTGGLKPLNRKDANSVIAWVRYALEKKDPAVFEQLAAEKMGYANYIEGGQPKERAQFLNELKTRLAASAPLCEGYGTYEKVLQIWTSGWAPDWQIDQLCYMDCNPVNPPYKSKRAAFFLAPNKNGDYELTTLWLNDDKIWRDVYKVQIHSCSEGYIPPAAGLTCAGAPVTRLSKGGYAYASKASSTSNNVRSSPGLGANVLGLLQPGKAVQIVDGPLCVEGYVWWKVHILPDGITGWTAEGKGSDYWLIPCSGPDLCG